MTQEERQSLIWGSRLDAGQRLVLLMLDDHFRLDGPKWPSLAKLVHFTGWDKAGVVNTLHRLEADGIIQNQPGVTGSQVRDPFEPLYAQGCQVRWDRMPGYVPPDRTVEFVSRLPSTVGAIRQMILGALMEKGILAHERFIPLDGELDDGVSPVVTELSIRNVMLPKPVTICLTATGVEFWHTWNAEDITNMETDEYRDVSYCDPNLFEVLRSELGEIGITLVVPQ